MNHLNLMLEIFALYWVRQLIRVQSVSSQESSFAIFNRTSWRLLVWVLCFNKMVDERYWEVCVNVDETVWWCEVLDRREGKPRAIEKPFPESRTEICSSHTVCAPLLQIDIRIIYSLLLFLREKCRFVVSILLMFIGQFYDICRRHKLKLFYKYALFEIIKHSIIGILFKLCSSLISNHGHSKWSKSEVQKNSLSSTCSLTPHETYIHMYAQYA